jgi:AcrR family transcriptional regulator
MTAGAKQPAARDRILDTATALFYRHGINNVGIDMVIARSGVAKMTLYRHFPSKDELILAFLDKINADWSAWLHGRIAASRLRGRQRPLAVFDALEEWFGSPEFRGCPFIGTAAEFRDPTHPVHRSAWKFKQRLRDSIRDLLREAGVANALPLADQLLLLADGAIVRAAMENRPDAARAARRAAAVLLQSA